MAAASLMCLIAVIFASGYRANFHAFIDRQQSLLKEDTEVLARQISPNFELMGAHPTLTSLRPEHTPIIDALVTLSDPPLEVFDKLARSVSSDTDRIQRLAVVRGRGETNDWLYIYAPLSSTPLQARVQGPGALTSSDYFVLRYQDTAGNTQHRLVAFERLAEPEGLLSAKVAAFESSEEMRPVVLPSTARDRSFFGGAYEKADSSYLLIRLHLATIRSPIESTNRAVRQDRPITIAWGATADGSINYSLRTERSAISEVCRLIGNMPTVSASPDVEWAAISADGTPCQVRIDGSGPHGEAEAHTAFEDIHRSLAAQKQSDIGAANRGDPFIRAVQTIELEGYRSVELETRRSLRSVIAAWRKYSESQVKSFLVPMGGIALLTALVHMFLLRRISNLSRQARYRKGQPFVTDESRRRDEIGLLARRFGTILRMRDKQSKALHQQNQLLSVTNAHLRHAAQQIRHDIRSPLDRLGKLVQDNSRAAEVLADARRIVGEVVEDQQIYFETRPISIVQFLRDWCRYAPEELDISGLQFEDPGHDIRARAYAESLEDVLEQLLKNAIDFRTPGTPIIVSAAVEDGYACIAFRNEGSQIPEPDLMRIFEYGYSSRAGHAPEHLGFGLYQVYRFVRAMGGRISAANVSSGVVFHIRLVLSQA